MSDMSSGDTSKARLVMASIGGFALGLILLVAAWSKTLDPLAFARQIEAEGLSVVLSSEIVALIALALEVGLGVSLMLMLRYRAVLGATTALVIFFLFLTGRAYWRFLGGIVDDDASCGCFGNLVARTPGEAFWQDLAMLVLPLGFAWAKPVRSLSAHKWRWIVVVVLTIATAIFAVLAPGLPIDEFATRLRPGVRLDSLCAGGDGSREPVCFDEIVPEAMSGSHLIILATLDQALGQHVEALNELYWSAKAQKLWVVSSDTEEARFGFRFGFGPAFEPRQAPRPLLAPLYRKLPRSFEVVDGVVVRTYPGLPPVILERDTLGE